MNLSPDDQILIMNNERFTAPEILFHPSDIGLQQGGLAEAIVDSIESCEEDMRDLMYKNILIVGGNANLPGLKQRL